MRSIAKVLASKNIAIFGASENPFKPGSMLIATLRNTGFTGRIAGVNPGGGEFNGVPLYRSIEEVPFDVDIASIIIPPEAVPEALKSCARKGVKGVVISSEGFSEGDGTGQAIQEEVRTILRDSNMRGFGPNTLGLVNTETGMTTSYVADSTMMMPGSVGFAAQSGIFVGALLMYMCTWPVYRISKALGLGNKVDVDESDALEYLARDEQTRIIGMYLEDIRDGRRFLDEARKAVLEKPVIILKGGRSEAGSTATATHTGSLAVNDAVLDGALRQVGVLRADGIDELLAMIMGFQWAPVPRGNRIAVVTFSGAQAIMAIDRASDEGLLLTAFASETIDRLGSVISSKSKRKNPVDIFPDMMIHGFEKTSLEIVGALLDDDGVDGILFIGFAAFGTVMIRSLADMVASKARKPVFFTFLGGVDDMSQCRDFMMERKLPVFTFPEQGLTVFARMWEYGKLTNRSTDTL
ncbi:MAG: CoA-binding protein [Syntrophales bacterium]|jgi:acetyltransferase|nr:CoA-binding protein [Syntrophales bacterium]MCK9528265.1 CoA-binding protein [Syntrophales bacterium]MDX9922397.1 CoA-binding protein [Syntrophales bacterium]